LRERVGVRAGLASGVVRAGGEPFANLDELALFFLRLQ